MLLRGVAAGVALVWAASVAAADLRPPESLGPPAPLATPAGGFVGKLELAPKHGPAGTPVTITGTRFPANEEIDLVWRTMEGRWKVSDGEYHGRSYEPVGFRIARVRTDASGNLSTSFTAPEDFGFSHDVVAQQGERLLTQAGFNIDMTMAVSPESGPPGTPITIDFKGIGWRQLENSWDLVYDNAFTGWVSAVTTRGSARFTIPATGRPGVHVLEAIHGEFTFPYRNPQQNPRPDRPRFSTTFRVTPGTPVLPPAPSHQVQTGIRGLEPAGDLVVTPAFAAVGTAIEVRAEGLPPGRPATLNWATMTGNRVGGGGFDEAVRPISEAQADASGVAVFRFAAPDDLGGAHHLSIESGGVSRRGVFTIVPSAVTSQFESVSAGKLLSLHLKGVGWTETANIYTMVYDNVYAGYACGFNSQGDVEIFFHATGDPGWHFIDLYPAIYKGQEQRPNNFRIPQLSFAADHPGEDLPVFRFALQILDETPAPSR